ncbi:MAG TPA: hypothetical protein VLH15_10745, partial [Dehalococcoidales bacterium]|nr:hypothetical protein [Dehalococcoidales bacterium]
GFRIRKMSEVKITRIDNFVCPACGEVMRQVAARDGIVTGYCHQAKCKIHVNINQVQPETTVEITEIEKPLSYLESLKQKRDKTLKEVVSAREDGDLKENAAYHAAREQLSILDDKILKEEDRLRREKSNGIVKVNQ